MRIPGLDIELEHLPAPLPIFHGTIRQDEWLAFPAALAETGGRLISVWGSDRGRDGSGEIWVSAAYAVREGLVWLDMQIPAGSTAYPDLTPHFPCAARMQRAMTDLLGISAQAQSDNRRWLNHGAWQAHRTPLRQEPPASHVLIDRLVDNYEFVRVEGDGVHEIPVGPVHAGIIEPGHFRFSVVGEKVLRLEERLGYTHKGIEKRFTELAPLQAHRLAGRVSGDTTVAYSWAYCMALESAVSIEIPERSTWLRALMLERERVANHLGDLGALGNDAALVFGYAQFSRLREDWLRTSADCFGHRLMMDCVLPGGVASDLDAAAVDRICGECDGFEREVRILRNIYDEHAGLQDRFITTGRVAPDLAAFLGLTGLAGRASGQAADLRSDQPWMPYDKLEFRMATHRNGDVAARVTLRFEETLESLRLIRALCEGLPPSASVRAELSVPSIMTHAAGWVEGWRGEVFVALELDNGRIRRCHCHDPSWQNWPVLEYAVIGNIVPDFPLINKSFNLSYSGHDL